MSQYFPPYNSSIGNIKVDLDLNLANYATKDDVKNITHVDVRGFASKTNLAALKTEVDKIDTDKLKTTPDDLAKLSIVVKNDVAKKTDYNVKVSDIEMQITAVNKNTLDNLADIKVPKTKTVDTSNFVTRTKFSTDANALDDKIDKVDKKIPDVSGLTTKTSLTSYLQTTTFNSKITEVENKISTNDALTKVASTKITNIETDLDGFKKSDLTGYAKKTVAANDITTIKNHYATNASVDSKINDLKAKHISQIVKKVEDKINKNEARISAFAGFFSYTYQSDLVYECKLNSSKIYAPSNILDWKPTNIYSF